MVTQTDACSANVMKKFEYKHVVMLFNEEKKLNQLGQEGWELVCTVMGIDYFLKREIN